MSTPRLDRPGFALVRLLLAVMVTLLPGAGGAGSGEVDDTTAPDPAIGREEILAHVKFLASEELEGRAAGSDGARKAADYIAAHFARSGIPPFGDDGTYFQNFELPRGFDVLDTSSVESTQGKRKTRFRLEQDFQVLSLSGSGVAEAEIVFAGYGVAAPDLEYDDYEGLDVAGKIVVVLRNGPDSDDPRSPFGTKAAQARYLGFASKLATAEEAGAVALVVVNDPRSVTKSRKDELEKNAGDAAGKIPCIHMTARAGIKIASLGKLSLQEAQKAIDKERKPVSRALSGVTLRIQADLERRVLAVRNVAALLKAQAAGASDEVLVVGAHFDHVGLGEFGSRGGSAARGKIHNGADDNASGTAGLLEIATYLVGHAWELRRDVLFLAFTAEEMGLLGSKHYVDKPLIPLAQTAAMVNLDMVGRLERQDLFIGGVGTSSAFQEVIAEANRSLRLPVRFGEGGIAPTDSATFYRKRIPVLFFFTGLHKDYHMPSDDWNRLDSRGEERIVQLTADVCLELGRRDSRPPFREAETGGFDTGGPTLGLGVEQNEQGVVVATIVRGSPGARAGILPGDVIVEVGGEAIGTPTDYFSVESGLEKGTRVEVVVRRKGRTRAVTLGLE